MSKGYEIETKCIQSGWKPKKGEPRVLPIYQSTTFNMIPQMRWVNYLILRRTDILYQAAESNQ